MAHNDLDVLFASPAALLTAGPEAVRELPAVGGGVGREAFAQAVAVLDGAEVSRAEFASWLHFGAKVLGHDAYAGLVAEAEPGMPWRTLWAWWRPVGAYWARPNLSGDADVEVHEGPDGRVLLKLWAQMAGELWLDPATGEEVPAPGDGEFTERPYDAQVEQGPVMFDPDEDDWGLFQPGTWEEPIPLGLGRFVLFEERGIVVVERNGAVAADWPATGTECASWGVGEAWFAGPTAAGTPLTTARLEAAFGSDGVLCLPQARQPAALTHAPTREVIAAAGLPRWWAAGVASFTLAWTETGADEVRPEENGLLRLGTFDLRYADTGKVYVHPDTGAVWMVRNDTGPFPFAPDTETFIRLLEAVYRYMGACWSSYPGENGKKDFLSEVSALDPLTLATGTPGGEVWEHLFAAIVELSAWGY
ncbi:SUKH-4 family immunity protein [Streptomyces sp. NBC_00091]|uniref:SUKH-4 family immunity protein n=1 Tax=Streptomyces sp. NBC_00091 TaxID=2975648 RepID=UPI002254DB96|nr:SUKH-4 family immunity protein [Streptomyces sp. NBC_00091]MCX5380462.1 SUKH-4 family immunity protein [Streptomyces sp. NBC_00091]